MVNFKWWQGVLEGGLAPTVSGLRTRLRSLVLKPDSRVAQSIPEDTEL